MQELLFALPTDDVLDLARALFFQLGAPLVEPVRQEQVLEGPSAPTLDPELEIDWGWIETLREVRLSQGDQLVLVHRIDGLPVAMESTDRSCGARIAGLPGGASLSFTSGNDPTAVRYFKVSGPPEPAGRAVQALHALLDLSARREALRMRMRVLPEVWRAWQGPLALAQEGPLREARWWVAREAGRNCGVMERERFPDPGRLDAPLSGIPLGPLPLELEVDERRYVPAGDPPDLEVRGLFRALVGEELPDEPTVARKDAPFQLPRLWCGAVRHVLGSWTVIEAAVSFPTSYRYQRCVSVQAEQGAPFAVFLEVQEQAPAPTWEARRQERLVARALGAPALTTRPAAALEAWLCASGWSRAT